MGRPIKVIPRRAEDMIPARVCERYFEWQIGQILCRPAWESPDVSLDDIRKIRDWMERTE